MTEGFSTVDGHLYASPLRRQVAVIVNPVSVIENDADSRRGRFRSVFEPVSLPISDIFAIEISEMTIAARLGRSRQFQDVRLRLDMSV